MIPEEKILSLTLRIEALRTHLVSTRVDSVTITNRGAHLQTADGEYLVLTDDEADELWNEGFGEHMGERIGATENPDLDIGRWITSGVGGRGEMLATHDGCEEQIALPDGNGGTLIFYIYRTAQGAEDCPINPGRP